MRGNSQNDKIKSEWNFMGFVSYLHFTITAGFLTRPSAQRKVRDCSNIRRHHLNKIKRLPLHQITLSLHQRISKLLALPRVGICSITILFMAAHLTGHSYDFKNDYKQITPLVSSADLAIGSFKGPLIQTNLLLATRFQRS